MCASFDRGVLEVRVPRPEQRKPRKVSISVRGDTPAIDGSERHEADPEPGALAA
ncbi:MAG: hypothetical protein ACR2LV_10685 [Solirubrobacteraceae bacterium]